MPQPASQPNQTQPLPSRGAALARLDILATALEARGLSATVEDNLWRLTARNEAAAPDNPRDPLAAAFPIRLVQRIQAAIDPSGALAFYWEWNGPTRDAAGDVEYLGPAVAIDAAADKIAYVLALVDA